MIKKIAFGLSCMALVMLAGCEKEEQRTAPARTANEKLRIPPAPCAPYRVVLGSALMAELTTFANCELTYQCTPNTTTLSISPRLIVPGTSAFFQFTDGASISLADQASVLQEGKNYANANIPAGYTILRIQFKLARLTNPHASPDQFEVYVEVTYRKCL